MTPHSDPQFARNRPEICAGSGKAAAANQRTLASYRYPPIQPRFLASEIMSFVPE
jgi:hypothetical protein